MCVTLDSQQQQDDRYYRNDMDYDHYSHRGNRRKSLDRYAMRPGQYTSIPVFQQHDAGPKIHNQFHMSNKINCLNHCGLYGGYWGPQNLSTMIYLPTENFWE